MIIRFAWRYFKGKKSTQAIQIISWVSVGAMAIGTAALIIVLSVFNGFEGFIKDLYSDFYPQLNIQPVSGKTFKPSYNLIVNISKLPGVRMISRTLEEKVLFTNGERQVIATIKGVDSNYEKVTGISKSVRYGHMNFSEASNIPPLVLGLGVANRLGASEETHLPVNCYAFKKTPMNAMDMTSAYSSMLFQVTGVYVLQEEIDNQFVIAPISVVEELIQREGSASSIEIVLNPESKEQEIKTQIHQLIQGLNLKVESRYEQNKTLYFILKSERWAVYSILTLMLIIASFNIVGSLSMMVLDKEKDIAILKAMGMLPSVIIRIFISTGMLLSLIGGLLGCTLALLICSLQQYFGFIKLGTGGSFLIEAYPVKLYFPDFLLVLFTVVLIAFFASLIPALKAGKKAIELRVK